MDFAAPHIGFVIASYARDGNCLGIAGAGDPARAIGGSSANWQMLETRQQP